MNVPHLTIDELADAAEGLLDPECAAFVESHVADCPDCQAQSDALREVTATMHAEPAPAKRLGPFLRTKPYTKLESAAKCLIQGLVRKE